MGMTIYERADLYWVYSRLGPSHSGTHHGRLFVDGHLPAPVAGSEAHDFLSRGYMLQKWDGKSWWCGWLKMESGAWVPNMVAIRPLDEPTETAPVAPTVLRRRRSAASV